MKKFIKCLGVVYNSGYGFSRSLLFISNLRCLRSILESRLVVLFGIFKSRLVVRSIVLYSGANLQSVEYFKVLSFRTFPWVHMHPNIYHSLSDSHLFFFKNYIP